MPTSVEIGREGERVARQFLEQKGYLILEQNWHWHHYELDLVARQGDELVIVEVKTRGVDFLVDPEEAVDISGLVIALLSRYCGTLTRAGRTNI